MRKNACFRGTYLARLYHIFWPWNANGGCE